MGDEELVAIVHGFRAGLLDGRTSHGMCGVVCFALQGFLYAVGVPTILMASTPKVGEWKGHLWLALKDGRVLDPTADQYGDDRPAIHLGKPDPDIHHKPQPFVVTEAYGLRHVLAGKKRRVRRPKTDRSPT